MYKVNEHHYWKRRKYLFEKGAIYDCVIKGEINEQLYYKVYGDEFTLSCTEKEFPSKFLINQT